MSMDPDCTEMIPEHKVAKSQTLTRGAEKLMEGINTSVSSGHNISRVETMVGPAKSYVEQKLPSPQQVHSWDNMRIAGTGKGACYSRTVERERDILEADFRRRNPLSSPCTGPTRSCSYSLLKSHCQTCGHPNPKPDKTRSPSSLTKLDLQGISRYAQRSSGFMSTSERKSGRQNSYNQRGRRGPVQLRRTVSEGYTSGGPEPRASADGYTEYLHFLPSSAKSGPAANWEEPLSYSQSPLSALASVIPYVTDVDSSSLLTDVIRRVVNNKLSLTRRL
ncbi:hypothetical protein TREMEDRAFT_61456 [Tremella mesenterica DSM 1558]|uniref:uncharacterized protein n=1 Tax=Tremella mesenterica (strain ATCC 24925 / CBS 8224 / DSM 1558 / NBRC 9311 / NRRL Y-6157 / RJB 2259-6 / UBC 559-6) TaxID=578456 RepID=UPI0003F4A356|nr:uncharacterized protein TREMEDRAFT_61456 [Tremella mesenterica DSM 1558]EIW70941.1 hypothetical protein TREMEDRAFT_61456 [Tremella mesenterica DSM 1558]